MHRINSYLAAAAPSETQPHGTWAGSSRTWPCQSPEGRRCSAPSPGPLSGSAHGPGGPVGNTQVSGRHQRRGSLLDGRPTSFCRSVTIFLVAYGSQRSRPGWTGRVLQAAGGVLAAAQPAGGPQHAAAHLAPFRFVVHDEQLPLHRQRGPGQAAAQRRRGRGRGPTDLLDPRFLGERLAQPSAERLDVSDLVVGRDDDGELRHGGRVRSEHKGQRKDQGDWRGAEALAEAASGAMFLNSWSNTSMEYGTSEVGL